MRVPLTSFDDPYSSRDVGRELMYEARLNFGVMQPTSLMAITGVIDSPDPIPPRWRDRFGPAIRIDNYGRIRWSLAGYLDGHLNFYFFRSRGDAVRWKRRTERLLGSRVFA